MLMVEAVGKKAAFLREAVRVVGLQSAEVKHGRFEDLAPGLEQTIDLLLVRGVRLTKELSIAMQLGLRTGGKLFAFGASREIAEFNWRLSRERSLSDGNALLIFEVAG
jgi:16S rRNA G527 N7-methylase RsmG